MCHKWPRPSKIVVCQPSTAQKTKKTLFAGNWEDERVNVTGCSGGMCASTVEQGGVAGAEFSTDVTFSQWFCFLINACSSLRQFGNRGPTWISESRGLETMNFWVVVWINVKSDLFWLGMEASIKLQVPLHVIHITSYKKPEHCTVHFTP